MSALSPGLYRATVFGNDYVGLLDSEGDFNYMDSAGCLHTVWVKDGMKFTDARPLIVLDLPPERVQYVLDVLGRPAHSWTNIVAAQIEAQTQPARIPEPGLWGVVEAAVRGGGQIRFTYINASSEVVNHWVDIDDGAGVDWDDLIDPTLVREGVES